MVMFTQSYKKSPTVLERQLNQSDSVPSVPKNVATLPTAKAKANKNDRVVTVHPDGDCP